MECLDSLNYGPDTEVQCHLDPEFMSLSIPDGKQAFDINGDKFKLGISIILKKGCHGFIQKPFNLEQLSRKMRETLYR